jgi:hypothetical protein
MVWDLEHQEQVGVEPRGQKPVHLAGRKVSRKVLLYAALAVVPVLLFVLMLLLARP